MAITACAWCGAETWVKEYRFLGHGKHCCDYKCSADFRQHRDLGHKGKFSPVEINNIQSDYEKTTQSMFELALKYGCSRSTIWALAKTGKWIKFQRTQANRTVYRKVAAKKLGRPLVKGEQVHHIDGLISNNSPDNLFVFRSAKKHSEAHGSLERIAFGLYRAGLIGFDDQSGTYFLKELPNG